MANQIIEQTEVDGGIVLLTINRPSALNALNADVFHALDAFFSKDYAHVPDLKGVIVTGKGEKAFVAGADIQELQGINEVDAKILIYRGHKVMNLIESFHVPVIAAINGYALGGGLELALACHLRIASTNVTMGLPELKLGLIPGYGGTQRLVRYIGRTKALELILTSDFFSAEDGERLGLINKVVDQEDLLPSCQQMIGKISKRGPLAVRHAIKVINALGPNGMEMEKESFRQLLTSEQGLEGTTAFLEKRKPIFK